MFHDLSVTSEGQHYLGSFIGTPTATSQYVVSKDNDWIDDIRGIIKAAHTNPQLIILSLRFWSLQTLELSATHNT